MSESHTDRDLERRFGALRSEAAADAPDFDSVIAGVRRELVREGDRSATGVPTAAPGRRRLAWSAGLLAAAAALVIVLTGRSTGSEDGFVELASAYAADPALGSFRSPTQTLLEIPGGEVVTTIPRLGDVPVPPGMATQP